MEATAVEKRRRGRWWWVKWVLLALVLGFATKFILHLVLPRNFAGTGERIPLPLSGPPFDTLYYCGPEKPRGIVILGTGDGGWSWWEEKTAKHLVERGYAVGGWDCRKFADTRKYDLAALAAGFHESVKAVRKRSGADSDAPVWYGGWSTGAEQSLVAATSSDRPAELKGLLLAAPGTRGRFGITAQDLLGATPEGPDTFALAEIAKSVTGVKVVQFAAGLDPLDDTDWIKSLTVPWRLQELPGKLHDMGGAGEDFQKELDEAMQWTLTTQP